MRLDWDFFKERDNYINALKSQGHADFEDLLTRNNWGWDLAWGAGLLSISPIAGSTACIMPFKPSREGERFLQTNNGHQVLSYSLNREKALRALLSLYEQPENS